MRAKQLKSAVSKYLKQQYGSRCKDYEKDCPCCDAWRAYDTLFSNIDSEV